MRRVRHIALLLGVLLVAVASRAQSAIDDLPRPSQHAEVVQRIGVSDITINYSRPLVNGRKVFGGLEAYGKVWRAGANENTTIAFSDPVTIDGKPLDRGTYGLHMIPGENEWTVIFSKANASWGSFTYDQKEDALRVTVKPQASEFTEALTYEFDDLKPDSSVITMRWDKVAVPFKVAVNVNEVVEQNMRKHLRGLAQYTWDGWNDAADYLVNAKVDLERSACLHRQVNRRGRAVRKSDDQVAGSGSAGAQRRSGQIPHRSFGQSQRNSIVHIRPPAPAREETRRSLGRIPCQ